MTLEFRGYSPHSLGWSHAKAEALAYLKRGSSKRSILTDA
jgi:hypothetical protein